MTEWGRNSTPSCFTRIGVSIMFFSVPFIAYIFQITNIKFNGSLINFFTNATYDNVFDKNYIDYQVFLMIALWIIFQMILFVLPDILHKILCIYRGGIQEGSITPAGNKMYYNINGLQALIITFITFFVCVKYDIIDPAWIGKNWIQSFIVANVYGYILTLIMYVKALYFSSHIEDNKYSGSRIYDIIMGVELNPRILSNELLLDIKLFFNGRPGIIGWLFINLSFAYYQYEKYGELYNSMILVNILQAIYVIDFFWNEAWYLKTIDISHDHFGWILTWGDTVWLPFMYTLQASYLINNPIHLTNFQFLFIGIFGLCGYIIFRTANSQKDRFRNGNKDNFKYIKCEFQTRNGLNHQSKLLIDGCWKYARHLNYTGDLMLSLAFCIACGFDNIIPYFYFVYMTLLLVIRSKRDDQKCKDKYKKYWKEYCDQVKWILIPEIY